ncbi:MAG: helicase-related protein, partial [Planctomycetota bacterium]
RPVSLDHNVFLAAEVYKASALKNLQKTVQRLKRRGAHYDRERDAHQVVMHLMKHRRLPCLFFCFSRKECEGRAKSLRNFRFLEGGEGEEITRLFDAAVARLALDPRSETVTDMRQLVRRGIAFHHAGLLPGIKDVVEQMFATGLIKLLVATETFALGVNMPAASVVFAGVKKFDGVRLDWMETREYTQMAGRAGRRGMDTSGTVMVLLEPRDHEPRALKHLFSEQVEPLVSSFNLSYGSICNLLGRVGGRIGETLEKSFAVHAGGRSREKMLEKMRRVLDARIRVLHRFRYLEKGELTEKGAMARLINGFEVYGCEWVFSNKLHELSDEDLAVLFMAGVYEERRNDWIKGTDWEYIKRRFAPFIASDELWRGAEVAEGLDPIKGLDFGFTRAVLHWYHGGAFEDFKDLCSSSEGDIVRHFLLCCQFLRQLSHVVEDPVLAERFKTVRSKLFRDVMDAETNLRRSCEA